MSVLLVQGGPGTGKTHILSEHKRRAANSGAICVAATGFRVEQQIRFATLSQLAHSPGIPDDVQSSLLRFMNSVTTSGKLDKVPAGPLRALVAELISAAARAPLYFAVDDAHHMDPASHVCLLSLARHARGHAITLALAYPRTFPDIRVDPLEFMALDAELIETGILRQAEVEETLATALGRTVAGRVTDQVYRLSGGNPALVDALTRDLTQVGPGADGLSLPMGDAFRNAYLTTLLRHPHLAEYIQAVAVLGEHATVARVARLRAGCPETTRLHHDDLERAGLLKDSRFRCPATADFVLQGMDPFLLQRLHGRAAELLFAEGAPAPVIARFLVASDTAPDAAQARVLFHASHHLISTGQVDEALTCLRQAERTALDVRHRDSATVELIRALWGVNPAAAEPEVRKLLDVLDLRPRSCEDLRLLAVWCLWFSWDGPAEDILARLAQICGPGHSHPEKPTQDFRKLVAILRPALLDAPAVRERSHPKDDGVVAPALADSMESLRAVSTELSTIRPSTVALPLGSPGFVLPRTDGLHGRPYWMHAALSVHVMVMHGDTLRSDQYCAELLGRLPLDGLHAGRAYLTGLHAHIRWCLGDLRGALERAEAALEMLPDHGWGIAIGLPLSVAINVYTILGEQDKAVALLKRPVPMSMQDSVFGSLYQMAFGRYLLSTDHAHAALEAFTSAVPTGAPLYGEAFDLLGWRSWAAEAYLALDAPGEARRMATAELAALGDGPSEARGRALAILAVTGAPEERRDLLQQAELALRPTGSRLTLAHILGRLSQVDLTEGRTVEARARRNEAVDLARECGVPDRFLQAPSASSPLPGQLRRVESEPVSRPTRTSPAARLSEAEWRVASLAAEGNSNRQIATELYITVSTVEQHLTRVYRKLDVRRRSALAGLLKSSPREQEPPDAYVS
ncbi:LuxR C-terminal-related transcriptional regulator [Streptomyces sp. NPDC091279]|uniref:LuxR C-terminal-related transcriptional regulator n=1 Tax=unclassified Streptomyces TaxID=2593676 RepID=UPI0037F8B2DD